jgi:hypothetical protein
VNRFATRQDYEQMEREGIVPLVSEDYDDALDALDEIDEDEMDEFADGGD